MTVLYSNFNDQDTILLKGIWEGLDAKVIEITLPSQSSQNNYIFEDLFLSVGQEEIDKAIEMEEDTLIICGHGSPEGCFSPHFDYTLSSSNKDKIKAKRVIGIWCHASSFAKENKVPGFFTSMFISNIDEAECMGIYSTDDEKIRESEKKFVTILNSLLKKDVPLKDWPLIFKSAVDKNNEVENYNFSSVEYIDG